ncbi:DNA replication complex GINS protein SLD5 isoform X1 [Rhododendron vialii]|uniref:DNA replication complex GINS protein SLD5 isoform X1 n=1 Tax=Rhododendron vialii TaxID=182163 RepID=UPI00265FCF5B|nr:DNA replication complex GINS protein SLD5 isoform X1 [Rhododendron vialii]
MDSGAWDGSAAADDHESLSSTNDAELLKRAWRTEKAAPEILQFEAGLVQRSREQIQLVEGNVEDLVASGSDPLIVSLNQMDMDRTLYLLRSYLRTRLQKIEKYMFHIHKNTELWNRLSEQEQKFAQRCIEDLEDHFDKSVLSKLPDRYKSSVKQSVISEEDDMVPEPQLDTYVICRTKGSLGALQLDNSGVEDPVDLDPGDLYAVRYKSIKPLVYSGQIELV